MLDAKPTKQYQRPLRHNQTKLALRTKVVLPGMSMDLHPSKARQYKLGLEFLACSEMNISTGANRTPVNPACSIAC